MNNRIQHICRYIVSLYKKDSAILGVMLFGSVVRGQFDKFSDVDIYILRSRTGRYSRESLIINNIRVDVIINTTQEAKTYLKEDKCNVRRNTSHMLAYGQIMYEHGKILNRLQKMAKNNLKLKTKYTTEEVLMHKYSIDDFWGEVQRDYKSGNNLAFTLDANLLINNAIELFLKLNGEYFRQPNEMQQLIYKLNPNLALILNKYIRAKNNKIKLRALSNLMKYIYKISGGALPDKLLIKR